MNKSTKEAVRPPLCFINENHAPLSPEAVFAFSDIKSMYDNVDCEEGVEEVRRLLEVDPSPLGMSSSFLAAGLKLCLECNCLQFRGKYYIPCQGCAQGTCHACTFTDLWVGKVVRKHLATSNIDSVLYSIYRDDGLDILTRGLEDQAEYQRHLDGLHPNLRWDLTCASEGGYLDLFIMMKEGRVEWKTYTKTPPLYLNRISCHDPKVFQSIPTGVGYRLRLTNSSNETFKENVELYSRAMATSGYDYQKVKKEMLKFENIDPVELAKKDKPESRKKKKGCKAFFISPFDPRLPHPRKIISKNYELLARHPKAKQLFPRENLIAASRRLKNLGEILSPTVQKGRSEVEGGGGPARGLDVPPGGRGRRGGRGRGGRGRDAGSARGQMEERGAARGLDAQGAAGLDAQGAAGLDGGPQPARGLDLQQSNGSFHCPYHQKSGKCDVCGRMVETRNVLSTHFNVKHSIAGHNVHLPATQAKKHRWFVYLEECVHPEGTFQYVGSTDSMTHRWANTKSKIHSLVAGRAGKAGTGLESHFKGGCSEYDAGLKSVRVALLEHMNVSEEGLRTASHQAGPGCQCSQCTRLKNIEDKWICRLGTFHGHFGLNERDEMRRRARGSY